MTDRSTSVCFTGHRELPTGEELSVLKMKLYNTICSLADSGYTDFYAGGARGFDTLAQHAVLYAREKGRTAAKLHIILPYSGKRLDERSLAADSITSVSDSYYDGCMHVRNRALVNSSSVCVCFLKHYSGGTHYTVRYAEQNGLKIIHL